MKPARAHAVPEARTRPDRRRAERYETTFDVTIRFAPDGSPLAGQALELGPNGMRLLTKMPLVEAAYVQITFSSASNNTFCEGRVVWTRQAADKERFESGIDVQRWGGGIPGRDALQDLPDLKPKKDRRKKPR